MHVLGLHLLLAFAPPEPTEPVAPVDDARAPTNEPVAGSIADPGASPAPGPVQDPSAAPPPLPASEPMTPPTDGGFGSVEAVTTESNVVAPAPGASEPSEGEDEDEERGFEIGMRVEIGYGQYELGNPRALDHQGAALRAELGFYPWLSKRRRIGVGVGLTYAYQGFNRRDLPDATGLSSSRGRQQLIGLRVPLLFRLHPEWFALEPSALIAGAFFAADDDVFVGGRRAIIPEDAAAFATGGDLAMCTLWEILCVVGGAEYLIGLETLSADDPTAGPTRSRAWSWHVGLGVDVFKALDRGNRLPS